MKNIISVILLLVIVKAYSQVNDNLISSGHERVIINQNSEVKGVNFLFEEWNKGVLFFENGDNKHQDFVQYNMYNDVIYTKQGNSIMEFSKNDLSGFTLIERKISIKHDFISLKKEDFVNQENEGFFEVIANLEGSKYLIKKLYKIIYDPNKSKGTQAINNIPKEYKDKKSFFLINQDGLYERVKLNKKGVKKVLNKNSEKMNAFIKQNNIKFNSEKDVIKLANYYYSL